MSSRALRPANAALYEEDFALWSADTVRLLREARFEEIDVDYLVEEVEGMAKSDRRELQNRLTVLLVHLLKWKLQSAKRSDSWRVTIREQRVQLERLFEESPSLRPAVAESIPRLYGDAVDLASDETRLPPDVFPVQCPFTPQQILDRAFLPE